MPTPNDSCTILLLQRTAINRQILTRDESRIHQINRRIRNILRPPRTVRRVWLNVFLFTDPLRTLFVSFFALVRYMDPPRSDQINANTPLLRCDGHGVCEPQQARLCRRVTFLIRIALVCSEGANVDDARPCSLIHALLNLFGGTLHVWDDGLADDKGRREVGLDVGRPLLQRSLIIHAFVIFPVRCGNPA